MSAPEPGVQVGVDRGLVSLLVTAADRVQHQVLLEPGAARQLADALFSAADDAAPTSPPTRNLTAGRLELFWDPTRDGVLVCVKANATRFGALLDHDQAIAVVDELSKLLARYGDNG